MPRILRIWFEELTPADWFGSSTEIDDLLRDNFEDDLVAQSNKVPASFLGDVETARAAILLFDQVPRNIYRGQPAAFAYDPLACEIARRILARKWDQELPEAARQFVIMPLMHSEALGDQQACVSYCEAHLPGNASYARSHHEMIARFGRFPHRNQVLGRASSVAEKAAIEEGFSW